MAKHTAPPAVPVEEQPYQVPDNWRWAYIGNLVTVIRGVSYGKDDAHKSKQENDVLILRGGNIEEGYIDTNTDNVYVNASFVSENQYVKKNDVIIVASTGSKKVIGRAGISERDYDDVSFGAFLILVRPTKSANSRFIDFYFQSMDYRNRIRDLATGININNIRSEYITGTVIPIPPLAEQERIVGRLESLFTKLDGARDRAQAVLDGYEYRRAAILHKAFTGELTAQWRARHGVSLHDWKHLELSQFASIRGGKRLPKGYSLTKEKTNHPYLRIADFGESSVDMSDLRYITDDIYETIKQYTIDENDVYLSIVGTIGKCGTIPKELSGANLTENAAKITTSSTVPEYLAGFLSSPVAQEDIRGRIRSSTLGKLSLLNIGHIVVPVPPKEEQFQIVGILKGIMEQETQTKQSAERVLESVGLMKKAILGRAFRGLLGTNNPEEPCAEIPL